LAWQSNRRRESIVTPSDFSLGATCILLPMTPTTQIVAADLSWGAVPRTTASDLSALSCRSFHRNQDWTVAEQLASLSRAGVASLTFMATSNCVSSANWWYEMPKDSMRSPTRDAYAVTHRWGTSAASWQHLRWHQADSQDGWWGRHGLWYRRLPRLDVQAYQYGGVLVFGGRIHAIHDV